MGISASSDSRPEAFLSASPEAGLLVKAPKSSSPPPASSAAIGSRAGVLSATCAPFCSVHQQRSQCKGRQR